MKTKQFHLGDVLSITTGMLVSPRHMDGVYDILSFMTDDPGLTTLGLLAVNDKCKEALLQQFPDLGNEKINTSAKVLQKSLEEVKDKKEIEKLVNNWLMTQYEGRGEYVLVSAICDRSIT